MQGPWYVLSPHIRASAEELLLHLEKYAHVDENMLESVIIAAMDEPPCTAAPCWAEPLWADSDALAFVGASFSRPELVSALGQNRSSATPRHRGLAAVAIALSRGLDGLRSLAEKLPISDGRLIVKMGYLASCTVSPTEPSRVRYRIKKLLREFKCGKSDKATCNTSDNAV
jgi:hypothetical protein